MSRLRIAIHRLGRRLGYELVAQRSIAAFLRNRSIDLVVDVGANRGQFGLLLRRTGYKGPILSFEPAASVFAALSAQAIADRNWTAMQLAIGAEDGEAELNLSERPVYSSLKPLTELATQFDPRTRYISSERVQLRRLDGIVAAQEGERIFVKADVQGFEREVIAGASGLLDRVHGIQLELPVEHLYVDVWTLPQAIMAMTDLGFTLAQVRPVSLLHDDPVSAIEFDCLFRRRR